MSDRDREWRRAKKNLHNDSIDSNKPKSVKKWKNLYTRSVKIKRAKQLGIDYPRTKIDVDA